MENIGNEPPFSSIIELLTQIIDTLIKRIKERVVIMVICCLIGTAFVIYGCYVISRTTDPKDRLANPATALIAIGGAFYTTVAYGLVTVIQEKKDKIASVEVMKSTLKKESESIMQSNKENRYQNFEDRFYNTLDNLFN